MPFDVVRSANDLYQAGRERVDIEALRGRNLNDRELVATQSCNDISRTQVRMRSAAA